MADGSLQTAGRLAPGASARPRSARKKLFAVHAWLGFHLAAVMALVLFTGTMATVSNEIDWLFQHDMRVSPDGEMVSWGEMEDAIKAERPGDTISFISAMEGDRFAYRAQVYDEYGRRTFVHVNQWTGEVTGETHPLTVQRFFRDLHRYLFMPNYIGLPLVTSLAFVLAVSLYTGLKTARNWRTLMVRVRTNRGARVLAGDAHKAAGVWSAWFFLVIVVTGVWYLVEFGVQVGMVASKADLSELRPRLTAERVEELGPVVEIADIDRAVAAAVEAYPELRPSAVQYPFSPRGVIAVKGRVGNPFVRDRSNAVYLDPESLDVVAVHRWREFPVFFALNEMADPLHFGYLGGLPTKLVWFLFGAAMTGLSLTGVWLTWRRLGTTTPSKAQFATMPALFVSMLFGVGWHDRLQGPDVPSSEIVLEARPLAGGASARLALATDGDGAPTGAFRIVVAAGDGWPAVESVSASAGDFNEEKPWGRFGAATDASFEAPAQALAPGSVVIVRIKQRGVAEPSTARWVLAD